ncbi:helix-turn-helix domain-containing protein [Paenibacillus sp. FSL H7-0756]|uniref:helix-turn-helix domain-containing protein n=1 Tax=Paenibacillus sp. FSL H7-0756 TaxID=2954738 RepID=UPI0030F5D3A6
MNELNLNNETILTLSEAALKWDLSASKVRQKIKDFPAGTARKFGTHWVVLEVGMLQVFGPIMIEEETDKNKLRTVYRTVKSMADEAGLSVERTFSSHAVLVGGLLLVWLDNMHWKELKLGASDYKSRDYGGKESLRAKMLDLKREIDEHHENVKCGRPVMDKFNVSDKIINYMIDNSIKVRKSPAT